MLEHERDRARRFVRPARIIPQSNTDPLRPIAAEQFCQDTQGQASRFRFERFARDLRFSLCLHSLSHPPASPRYPQRIRNAASTRLAITSLTNS